jgi:type II secretory ATPase GspE/PulE/Tfp pilus assembly ATPase PilB-like protein
MFDWFFNLFRGKPTANRAIPGVRTIGAVEGRGLERRKSQTEVPKHSSTAAPSPIDTAIAGKRYVTFGGLKFAENEIASTEDLTDIVFHRVINADVQMGQHMYSRIAIALLFESGKQCALFVDRRKATPDEIGEIATLLTNTGYVIADGYFAPSTIIISMSQGHLNGAMLKSARDIKRDPKLNALFQGFTDIVGWAYDNNADDLDFALDTLSEQSQICFKIGGRYIRPPQYLINTDTMAHLLGIAWQVSSGGASAQFDTRIEQQAQVSLTLPESSRRTSAARVRLRWSGMSNDRGTVVTMRLQRLGESALVKSLDQAGYLSTNMDTFRRVINSEGGLVCFAGPVGSGKSTSLAQLLAMLPPYLKIQSIEDPVELEIVRAYQKTVARDLFKTGHDESFLSAARAVYRSALDVMYLGEVRDTETGGIARQVVQSGHTVFTTIHARSGLGIVERLASPQIGIPRDVLGTPDILKLLVYQVLLPVNCKHCSLSPDDHVHKYGLKGAELEAHKAYFARIENLYDLDSNRYRLHDPEGCPRCRKEGLPEINGLNGRTVVCELVEPDEEMSGLIVDGRALSLQQYWRSLSDKTYDSENLTGKTAMECAIYKGAQGLIDPREIEARFSTFETIERKRRTTVAASKATAATPLRRAS